MTVAAKKIYIPGLNGVRALAALIVIFSHIDQLSERFNVQSIGFYKKDLAGYGVTMFFTLSGFLITYLLLIEKEVGVNIKRFYLRRILRIWPLYYLAVLIAIPLMAVVAQPELLGHQHSSLGMYFFFVPNMAYVLNLSILAITPLWSVGVEEQFYLIWPWLFGKSKSVLKLVIAVIVVYFLIKFLARFTGSDTLNFFIGYTRIDCMAIGAVGACLIYYDNTPVLKYFFHKATQCIAWLCLFYSVIFKAIHITAFIDHEVYSVIFLTVILNVGFNKSAIIKLENTVLNFIGKISYGIYVYHVIVIYGLSYLLTRLGLINRVSTYNMYSTVISVTLLLSYLSYYCFEDFFLRMKPKFSTVKSTNSPEAPVNGLKPAAVCAELPVF